MDFVNKDTDGFDWYTVDDKPFVLDGLYWRKSGEELRRLPLGYSISPGIDETLSWHTSGVMLRFVSDADEIRIAVKLHHNARMDHMAAVGSMGFDLYCGRGSAKKYVRSARFDRSLDEYIVPMFELQDRNHKEREFTLHFPLYCGVKEFKIGLNRGAAVKAPSPWSDPRPVVVYGTSIQQGGCASRPGNVYTSMLCRKVDAPQINLGFSGSARGEEAIAELIGSLKLSCFVYDYDYNAPTAQHLQATHEKFFKIVRKMQPTLPIIIMSRCNYKGHAHDLERRAIIYKTYENAVAAGDKNVYWVDGKDLFKGDMRDSCTVDGTHPNDLGFFRMYEQTLPALKKALKLTDK